MKIDSSTSYILLLYAIVIGIDPIRDEYLTGEGVQFGTFLSGSGLSIVFALIFVLFAHKKRLNSHEIKININLIAGLALCAAYYLATLAWSNNPTAGAKKIFIACAVIYASFLTAIISGRRVSYLAFLDFVGSVTILSVLAAIALPGAVHANSALDPELEGAWKGILGHKNHAGLAGGLILILIPAFFRSHPYRCTTYLLFSIVLIFMSKAKTVIPFLGLTYTLTSLAAMTTGNSGKRKLSLYTALYATAAAVGVMFLFSDEIGDILEDPTALTGRAAIWDVLSSAIADRPLLGYGFGGIFDPNQSQVLGAYTYDWRAYVYHSHNGYLEILLVSGAIGLMLWIVFGLIAPYYVINRDEPHEKTPATVVDLKLIMFLLLYNILETSFWNERSLGWAAWSLVIASASVSRSIDSATKASPR